MTQKIDTNLIPAEICSYISLHKSARFKQLLKHTLLPPTELRKTLDALIAEKKIKQITTEFGIIYKTIK